VLFAACSPFPRPACYAKEWAHPDSINKKSFCQNEKHTRTLGNPVIEVKGTFLDITLRVPRAAIDRLSVIDDVDPPPAMLMIKEKSREKGTETNKMNPLGQVSHDFNETFTIGEASPRPCLPGCLGLSGAGLTPDFRHLRVALDLARGQRCLGDPSFGKRNLRIDVFRVHLVP
jgi:hypothetical protein